MESGIVPFPCILSTSSTWAALKKPLVFAIVMNLLQQTGEGGDEFQLFTSLKTPLCLDVIIEPLLRKTPLIAELN